MTERAETIMELSKIRKLLRKNQTPQRKIILDALQSTMLAYLEKITHETELKLTEIRMRKYDEDQHNSTEERAVKSDNQQSTGVSTTRRQV